MLYEKQKSSQNLIREQKEEIIGQNTPGIDLLFSQKVTRSSQ